MSASFQSRKKPKYKPFVLKVNDVSWMNPFKIFLIIFFTTVPISLWLGTPAANPIVLAYTISITIYLVKRYSIYLLELKPFLNLTASEFKMEQHALNHFSKIYIFGGYIIAPAFFLFVNWGSPILQEIFSGKMPSLIILWSLFMAVLSWVATLQIITIILSDILQFKRLGKYHTKINLLNTVNLNIYSKVGISTVLIFAGTYTIIPIAYLHSSDLLAPVLLSLMITLPLNLFFLLAPILALRKQIIITKTHEISIITKVIEGDLEKIKNSHLDLNKQSKPSQIDLILYRKLIEDLDEWPLNKKGSIRLALYLLIPILTWVGSSFIDRIINLIM
jgi:hypothetical protein